MYLLQWTCLVHCSICPSFKNQINVSNTTQHRSGRAGNWTTAITRAYLGNKPKSATPYRVNLINQQAPKVVYNKRTWQHSLARLFPGCQTLLLMYKSTLRSALINRINKEIFKADITHSNIILSSTNNYK